MSATPNDLRIKEITIRRKIRVTGEQRDQEAWTQALGDIIRQVLFREPNLKDYTLFNCIHKTGCRNTQIFYNEIYIGYVSKFNDGRIGGSYKFHPND